MALACFYATAVQWVTRPVAVVGTLFLAFNPAQLWVGRITLSEILAQVLIWAALALVARLDDRADAALARWAGFLLGLVALARVDGFVLLPLVFAAQGATWALGRRRRGPSQHVATPWPFLYQTAVPTFALAAVSYALWSPFYFDALTPYLVPVALVALVVLYPVLAGTPGMQTSLRRLAASKVLRVAAVVLFVGASVWAYWVRPISQPTEEESRQWYAAREAAAVEGAAPVPAGDGPHWGRNTVSNLGRYLSPWVLGLAVLGVACTLWKVLALQVGWGALTCFVLWGGFSVAYLGDPAVDPLHFWAIRRFVPLILPGCVLMAALGWRFAARRLPVRLRVPMAAAILFVLSVHTISASAPLAVFTRDQGITQQLRAVAEALPKDDVILVPTSRPGWARWQTPLYLTFERPLHPFDPSSPRRMAKVASWIEGQRLSGKPVYLLAEAGVLPESCCPGRELAGRFPLNRQLFEPTYWPVPKTVRQTEIWLEVHRLPPR